MFGEKASDCDSAVLWGHRQCLGMPLRASAAWPMCRERPIARMALANAWAQQDENP